MGSEACERVPRCAAGDEVIGHGEGCLQATQGPHPDSGSLDHSALVVASGRIDALFQHEAGAWSSFGGGDVNLSAACVGHLQHAPNGRRDLEDVRRGCWQREGLE